MIEKDKRSKAHAVWDNVQDLRSDNPIRYYCNLRAMVLYGSTTVRWDNDDKYWCSADCPYVGDTFDCTYTRNRWVQ